MPLRSVRRKTEHKLWTHNFRATMTSALWKLSKHKLPHSFPYIRAPFFFLRYTQSHSIMRSTARNESNLLVCRLQIKTGLVPTSQAELQTPTVKLQQAVWPNPHTSSHRTGQIWPRVNLVTKPPLPHFITLWRQVLGNEPCSALICQICL